MGRWTDEYIVEQANEAMKLSGSREVMLDHDRRDALGKTIMHLVGQAAGPDRLAKRAADAAFNDFFRRVECLIKYPTAGGI